MKRFAGIALIAFAAHSGPALAQGVPGTSPDDMPRGRAERSAPGDIGQSQTPGRLEREAPQRQLDSPSRAPRGAQSEEFRSQEPQRGQAQQREQEQQRSQAQREQEQQRSQAQQREREQQQQRSQAQQREQEQQRSQVQQREQEQQRGQVQPDSRRAPSTAQPGTAPSQDDNQRSGSTAQRSGTAQPGTAGSQPTGRQAAEGDRADPDRQRIVETVRERVERNEIRPAENIGASVSVGAELPSRVQLQPLPNDIVSIRPQYRDYRYTVSDREIVIVDPRSRRIVEVIERDGGRTGGADIYASFEQRRDLRRWRRPDNVVFQRGTVLPAGAPYYDLPVEVVERNPNWRGYQYVMTETEEVAIVEPQTHRIVDVVDRGATRSAVATTGRTAAQSPAGGSGDRRDIARIIIEDARPGEMLGIDGLKGAVLPNQVTLRPIPAEVEERDQQLRGYQYTLIGDDVLIVDPQSRRIVDVIE